VFKVVAGILNLQQYVNGVQEISVDHVFRHELYNSTVLANDIAVIKLRNAARIDTAVYPICLPNSHGTQDPKVGQSVYIAGWGYTDNTKTQVSQQLEQAVIQVLPIDGNLNDGLGCSGWLHRGYSLDINRQICAMSRNTRTDSCHGDSGGPLISEVGSTWFLFGIVSYGDALCASSTTAGVYTRVSAYVPWIHEKVKL
jgi:secreted trypsin-like serine protease